MKTILHRYLFDIREADELAAYNELSARLLQEIKDGTRGHWMHCIATEKDKGKKKGAFEVELETKHLFENQWNTPTERVFDWFEAYQHEDFLKHLKWGHWLEITPEMIAIRRDTLKCGYTGQQFPRSSGLVFNETAQGLGSEYLKESDLPLLRLLPVCDDKPRRKWPALTAKELAYLLPKYRAAQKEGAATRAGAAKAKARADVLQEFKDETTISEKKLRNATIERDGKIWLLDRGFSLDNVIYYDHTGNFCFGWRREFSPEEKSALLDVLSEFPFEYEFSKRRLG